MAGTQVFLYGTLKRGQRNHRLLAGQRFLGEATTAPHYRLYDCGRYPCLVDVGANGVAVKGEVWEVGAEVLARLDAYEEVPQLYTRHEIELVDQRFPVLAYFYNGDVTGFTDCGGQWPRTRG
jgi:gamma-glutamylaminecyclotransferase